MKTEALALALLLGCGRALAAPVEDPRIEAKARFAAGSAFFEAQSYNHAVEEYLAAYRLLPKPDFLFNIAQAYRLKGDRRAALAYYRRYLVDRPTGRGSDEARQYVAEIEAEVDPAPPEPAPAPVAAPPPVVAAPVVTAPATTPTAVGAEVHPRRWLWLAIGAAAAVVVVALAVGLGVGLSEGSPAPPSTFFGTVAATFR